MNKKYEPSKETRSQEAHLDKQDAARKQAEQENGSEREQPSHDGGLHKSEQQRSEQPRQRQQGGWNPDQDRSGGKPAGDRDRDYDPDGDRSSGV